jgi:hypothetical protein
MLETAEGKSAGTMSFVSITNAVAVAMKQWNMQCHAFILEILKVVILLIKHSKYFLAAKHILTTDIHNFRDRRCLVVRNKFWAY